MRKTEECLQCRECWERKPISEYYEQNRSRCKECLKKYVREYKKRVRGYRDVSLFEVNETQIKKQKEWKTCSWCWIFKPIDEFYKDSTQSSWYSSRCKECKSKYYKERCNKKAEAKKKVEWKKCSSCWKFKSYDFFSKKEGSSDWYQSYCQECVNKYYREHYRKKKESKIKTFFKKLFRIK